MNNSTKIPCSVVIIEDSIKGMPCNKNEKISIPPNKLADKMDINQKKLVITGWWWLAPHGYYSTILAIADNEISLMRRVIQLIQIQEYYTMDFEMRYDNNQVITQPINNNQVVSNYYKEKWIFITATVNLDDHFICVLLYSPEYDYKVWAKLTGATMFSSFTVNHYISIGTDSITYDLDPGCGKVADVRLYPNFAFSDQNEIDLNILIKHETNIQLYFPFNQASDYIQDKEKLRFIYNVGTNIPQVDATGLLMDSGQFLQLPEISQIHGEILINFWIQSPSATAGTFIILKCQEIGSNSPQITLSMIPGSQNNHQILNINYKGTNTQLTSLNQFLLNSWYCVLISCHQVLGNSYKFNCNIIQYSASNVMASQSTSYTDNFGRFKRILYTLGDTTNTVSFKIKSLIIGDGSKYNLKDSSSNCANNCELYLSNGYCLICATGQVLDPSQGNTCIATSSCSNIDSNINICKTQSTICSGQGDSQIYQNFQKAPACTTCLDQFFKSSNDCQLCKIGCLQCSDQISCTSCTNGRTGANCDCANGYYDDKKSSECILKQAPTNKIPSYTKYVKLDITDFSTYQCETIPASPQNQLDIPQSTLQSTESKKLSFTFWLYSIPTDNSGQWIHPFYLHRQPIVNHINRVLDIHQTTYSQPYTFKILQNNNNNNQYVDLYHDMPINQWMWIFITIDSSASSSISQIYYRPINALWNFQIKQQTLYTDFSSFTDLQAHFGTVHTLWAWDCTMYGKINNAFYYQGISAAEIQLDYNTLFQMMQYPDIPIMSWKITQSYSQVSSISDEFSTSTITKPVPSSNSANFQEIKGIIITGPQYVTLSLFDTNDFTIHYWWYREFYYNDNNNMIIYSRQSQEIVLESLTHHPKLGKKAYSLQICIFSMCVWDLNDIIAGKWNFIAVNFHRGYYKYVIIIKSFINSKHSVFTVTNNYQGTTTNIQLTLGNTNNTSPNEFWIKDFGIDQGGALLNYDNGGYSAINLPYCVLKTYKSSLNSGSGYCLLCEWGYYVNNGTCTQSNRYCNSLGLDCIYSCPNGKVFEQVPSFSCVTTCSLSKYYFIDTTKLICVSPCPNNYYGDPTTQQCVQNCPSGFYPNATTQICWQTLTPCSNKVVYLEQYLRGMPCQSQEILYQDAANILSNKIDITKKKLTATGWWLLQSTDNTNTIFSIQESEAQNQYKRALAIHYKFSSNVIFIEQLASVCPNAAVGGGLNQTNIINDQTQTTFNYFFNQWIFIVVSIDLDQSYYSIQLYSKTSGYNYIPWVKQTGANCYTSFNSNQYINYGINQLSAANNLYPGCGLTKNIRLYSDFAYSQQYQIPTHLLMKEEANIRIYYGMITPGQSLMLIDQSGNNNHANSIGDANVDPIWDTGNKGVKFNANKYIMLPEIAQNKNDYLISFWLKTPSSLQQFKIVQSIKEYENTKEVVLQIAPDGTNTYGVFSIQAVSSSSLITNEVKQLHQFAISSWYNILTSCSLTFINELNCNITSSSNGIDYKLDYTTFSNSQRSKRIRYQLGDSSNAGNSFTLRELIIADGSMYSYKNNQEDCVSHCELYLTNGVCILCSTGYTQSGGSCIATGSCTTIDTDVNICASQVNMCAYQLFKPPTCTSCLDFYYKSGTTCSSCQFGCQQCSSYSTCAQCFGNRQGTNCECPAQYFDGLFYPECILKAPSKVPPYVKYLNLQQSSFTSISCTTNPANPVNQFDTILSSSTISTTGNNKISFTLWIYLTNLGTTNWVHALYLHRQPIVETQRLLNLAFNSNSNAYLIKSQNGQNEISFTISSDPNQKWVWFFLSLDALSQTLSSIIYSPGVQTWVYRQLSSLPWSQINFSDIQLHLGTQHPGGTSDCTMSGNIASVFFYQGIATSDVSMDYSFLHQMTSQPNLPIAFWTITNGSKGNQVLQDLYNSATLQRGPTNNADTNLDPSFHILKGIIFSKQNVAVVQLFSANDFTIHYWFYKQQVNVNVITYISQNNAQLVQMIKHIAQLQDSAYLLQVCLFDFCAMDSTILLPINKWNFIAIALHFDFVQTYTIQTFINTKHHSYIVDNYTQVITMTSITLGHSSNQHNDKFFMKDFGIDMGGALLTLDTGGITSSGTEILPHCLLRVFKSSLSNGNQYCLYCEWGYYIQNGTCIQGFNYCNEQLSDCIIICPVGSGLFLDTVIYDCVTSCPIGYFADNTTFRCVKTCPDPLYYGNSFSKTCVLICPSLHYGDPLSRKCVMDCPPNYFADDSSHLCTSPCPNNQFGNPNNRFCVTSCPVGLFGDAVTNQCVDSCPSGYYSDSLTQLCIQSCPNGYFKDSITNQCVLKCPKSLFADIPTRSCLISCTAPLLADQLTNLCVSQCPYGYFGDSTAGKCVTTCPINQFGDVVSATCLTRCPDGFFGDPTTIQCATTCPSIYFKDMLTNLCAAVCSSSQFSDPISKRCVSTCPNSLYGDSNTKQCVASCPTEYFASSLNQQCVQNCPNNQFGDENSGLCVNKCPFGLIGDLSIKKCVISCSQDTYQDLILNLCVINCPSGLFGDPLTKTCIQSCQISNLYSDSTLGLCVSTCSGNLFGDTKTFQCVTQCATNYFGETIKKQCVQTCPGGFFGDLVSKQCVANCPTGYFGDPFTYKCTSTCSNGQFGDSQAKQCTFICSGDQFANILQGQCITTCPSGYFGNTLTKLCVSTCPITRFGDPSTVKCEQKCSNGYYGNPDTGLCVVTCPANYFGDPIINRCVTTCSSNSFADTASGLCMTTCPTNTFGDQLTKQCISTCPAPFYGDLITSKCVLKCPNGYFGDNQSRKCHTQCPSNLYGDTVINLCVSYCSSGQYVNSLAMQCVTTCPAGLFGDYSIMQCVNNCPTGQFGDPSTSKCVSTCPATYYADATVSKKCVLQCPAGQFGDNFTVKCVNICSSGQFGDSTLQICVKTCPLTKFGDSSTWKCVGICPDGTYGDNTSQKCNINCPIAYFADPSTKTCVQDCPATLFADQQEGKCLQSCSTFGYYADPVLHKCVTLCSADYFGESITFKCVQTCPAGYSTDNISRKCVITCPNEQFGDPITFQCGTTCPTNYFKDASTWMCVLRCPKNYFSNESTKECTTYCPAGSYGDPTTNKCVTQCLQNYFGNIITLVDEQQTFRICEICDISCNQCTASSNFFCVQCNDGYYQKIHTNSSKQCLPCHSLCTQCFGESQFNCTQCQPLIILYSQSCTQKCHEFPLMFADPYNLECKSCNPICISCSGPTKFECIECINGYFLSNFICQECLSPCIYCYGPEDNQCYSCVTGYYLEAPSTCKACPDVCLTCTDPQTCQTCKTNRGGLQCDCSLIADSINHYPKSLWCGTCEVSVLSITFSANWTQINIEFGFEVTLFNFPQQQLEIPSIDMCNYLFPSALTTKFGTSPACNLKQSTKDSIIIHLGNSATILLNEVIQINQQTVTKKSCDNGGLGSTKRFSFYDLNVTTPASQPNQFSLEIQSTNKTFQKCEEFQLKIGNIFNDGSRGIKYLNWSHTIMSPLDRVTRAIISELIKDANHNQSNIITFPSDLLLHQTNYTFKVYCENFFNQNATAEINITIYLAEQQKYCSECSHATQNFICPKCQTGVIHQDNICTLSCIEFPGNYPDIIAKICKPCDPMCIQCTGSSANDCTVCTNKFYLEGQICMDCDIACFTCSGPASYQCSACNEGYYYKSESQCLACPEVCKACVNRENCTSCRFNRVGQLCDCPSPEGIPYTHTNWCGTCQIAVVSIQFAQDWLSIIIDFGIPVVLSRSSDQEDPSNQKCNDLFPPTIYSKLGTTANCSLAILKRDKIIIQLDSQATILLEQEFTLNPNSIHRKDCLSQNSFETLINNKLLHTSQKPEFKITINGPNYRPTICEQIIIQIDQIINDGLRGLKNLTWSLSSISPSNPTNQANVETILSSANLNQNTIITFPSQTLIENTEYIFSLYGFNQFDQNYTAFFTLHTSYSEGIQLKLDNSSDQALFPRYQNITLKVIFKHLICQNDGTFQEISDIVKYQWQQLQQTNNYSLGINETEDYSNPDTNYSEITIPSFTTQALNVYDVKFTVSLINVNISESIYIKLNISQAALQANIIGGSKVTSVSKQFTIKGNAIDRDVNPNYSNQYEGMNFTWECQDLNTLSSCYDIKGNLIILEQNKLEQKFNKKTFLPYKSYKFTFTVFKGQRVKSSEAIIMFIEIDLPQLAVDVPSLYLDNRINLQDQIYLTMQYSNIYNPDTLFYSAVLIYDYEEVGIMIFDFLQVRFRIWDYFSNFNQSNIDLIVRFSIYNPLFIMPSQIMIPFKVNTVPSNCMLNINPSIGDSLQTNFSINVSGCQDQDMPLTYQFFAYMSIQEQQEELIDQLLLKRNQLIDYHWQSTLITQLPQGYPDFNMSVVIMASIKDSFGGIANITQNITVNKNSFVINNDKVNYLQTLKQMFAETNGTDIDTQMRLLSIIVIDYTNSAILEPTNSQFNALKMQILDKLYEIKLSIQGSNSTWDQQITRLIGIIMKNSTSFISSISKVDADKQINNMDEIVNSVGSQLNNMALDGSEQEKATKLDTLLINCAQIVDGMLVGFNDNDNQTTFSQNETNQKNQQMIKMTQEISKLMVLNALPNENPKLYLGQTLKIKSQIITPKHLSEYLGSDIKDWADSPLENESNDNNFTIQMYKVAFKSYNTNPYAKDPQFPYQNKTFKVIDPGIYQGNNYEKMNLTQSITHVFTVKQEDTNTSNSTNATLLRKRRSLGQNTSFTCISLNVNKQWNAEQCEKLEQKQPDGTINVKCICKDLSVATIGEDIVNIFANNKNIQLILSEEGLSNLQNIEFYKYVIFYIGIIMTLLWFYLLYKGIQLDKLTTQITQIKITDKTIFQQDQAKEQINTPNTIQHQSEHHKLRRKRTGSQLVVIENNNKLVQENLTLLVNSQSERQSLQHQNKKSQHGDYIENQIEVISNHDISPVNNQLQDKNNEEIKILQFENQDHINESPLCHGGDLLQRDNSNDKKIVDSDQQLDIMDQDKIKIDPLNKNTKQQETSKQIQLPLTEIEEKQEYEKPIDPQKQLENNTTPEQSTINFLTGVMSYHEFFSIFSLNEPTISRPVRFTLYYIKTIYLMAMTIVFSQTLNPIQTIALSAISGIAYSIIASLIKLLLKISLALKAIGVLVSMGICFVCWYSTLVVTASKSPEESNYWSLQFFGALFSDVIIVQLLVGTTKYSIFLLLIKRKFGFTGFVKKFSEILVKVLMNQKLKSVFNRFDQL